MEHHPLTEVAQGIVRIRQPLVCRNAEIVKGAQVGKLLRIACDRQRVQFRQHRARRIFVLIPCVAKIPGRHAVFKAVKGRLAVAIGPFQISLSRLLGGFSHPVIVINVRGVQQRKEICVLSDVVGFSGAVEGLQNAIGAALVLP